MELSTHMNPAASRLPPPPPAEPMPRADLRPAADRAAVVRDPRPELPFAIPPATTQIGAVSAAMVSSAPKDAERDRDTNDQPAIDRLLKPYGIAMLPERHDAPRPKADPQETGDPLAGTTGKA